MVDEQYVLGTCNLLKKKFILIPPQNPWLRSCIEYFVTQESSGSLNSVYQFVYDQWLLADLVDIAASCIPNNCTSVDKIILQGTYAVQVNYAVNIAESFYKQLQEMRRPDSRGNLEVGDETVAPESKSRRSLKMEITDGVIKLIAFEDQYIKKMPEPLSPGLKVLLIGPIECRKGVLLLKEFNVQVLGGEVDTLLIPNAPENILARALGVEENPDPYRCFVRNTDTETILIDDDDDDLLMVANEIENTQSRRNEPSSNKPETTVSSSTQPYSSSTQPHSSTQPYSSSTQPHSSRSIQSSFEYDFDDDDFELIAAETASIAEKIIERKVVGTIEETQKHQTTLRSFLSPLPKISQVKKEVSNKGENNSRNLNNHVSKIVDHSEGNELREKLLVSYGSKNSLRDTYTSKDQTSLNKNMTPARTKINNSLQSPTYSQSSTIDCDWRPCLQNASTEMPRPSHEKEKVLIDFVNDNELVAELLNGDLPEVDDVPAPKNKTSPKETFHEPFPPKSFPSERTVFASVIKVPQKLSVKDDSWCLGAIISTKGVELEVDFSPKALNKVFGITASEIKAKRNEARENPEMKGRINEILKASQQRFRNLKCEMILKFTSLIGKALVLDVKMTTKT